MRWVIGIVVVAVLAVLGYEHFRPGTRPSVAEGTVRPAAPVADSAAPAATTGSAAAPEADRTRAIEEQAALKAQQAASETTRKMQETAERVAKAAQDVATSTTDLEVGDTDVGKRITDAVDRVTTALDGVTDQASAQAAVPKLIEIDARLYELRPTIEKLPDDAKKTLATLVTGMLPRVQGALDRVEANPDAGDVVKPALDPILLKLDDWSRRPV